MTTIIGLLGGAGAGKSTVAAHLVDKYGARRYSFAQPLKEIVRLAFDLSLAQVYGDQRTKETVDERYNVTPRWLMTRIGTQGIRDVFGADVWLRACLDQIAREAPALAVIDDVRFHNEADGLRAAGGIVWRLTSPIVASAADASHQSEAEWSTAAYDYRIGPQAPGLAELYELVDQAAARYDLCNDPSSGRIPSPGSRRTR